MIFVDRWFAVIQVKVPFCLYLVVSLRNILYRFWQIFGVKSKNDLRMIVGTEDAVEIFDVVGGVMSVLLQPFASAGHRLWLGRRQGPACTEEWRWLASSPGGLSLELVALLGLSRHTELSLPTEINHFFFCKIGLSLVISSKVLYSMLLFFPFFID